MDRNAAIIAPYGPSTSGQVALRMGLSRATVCSVVKRAHDAGAAIPIIRAAPRCPRPVAPEVAYVRPTLPPVGVRAPTVGTPMPRVREEIAFLVQIDLSDALSLIALSPRQCRAINRDDPIGACCALPVEGQTSWCRSHRARFRQPARLRPVTLPKTLR